MHDERRGPDQAGAAGFLDLVARQRACRAYREDPVDDAVVAEVLRAATFAPSSENKQPWVFVVVRDPQIRAGIGRIMAELWEAGGRAHTERSSSPSLFADVDAGVGGGGIARAPVLVVVAGDTRLVPRQLLGSSIFPAVQNMLLAASSLGLGSALTTLAAVRSRELGELVGLPEEIEPRAVVPLGYPAKPLGPPRRVPFQEKTSRDRYGNPWDAGAHR